MIRFMKDASEYGSYHRELSRLIQPCLQGSQHICDAGCGLGSLAVELSRSIPQVTAIDIKPQAVAVLREECTKRGITNIRPLEGDIRLLPPESPYDGMVFCFYGMSEEILEIARRQCSGPVAVIKKNYCTHRFSVGEHPTGPDGFSRMSALLNGKGIPFQGSQFTLEFGQPFRDFNDVRTFFSCYSRDEDPSLLTDDFLHSKVIETGDPVFPLYMPHQRKLGMIFFNAGDIK